MASPNAVQYNSNGYGASPTSQVNSRDVAPQYPQMDVMPPDKPLLEALGAPGTAIFSGIITSEEYNPDWYWRDGIKILEQMVRNDPQINATRNMLELPIRRAKWSIVPGSDSPQDQEVASFVESCLFEDMCYQTASGRLLHQHWDDLLRHILMHLTYGFIPFEINYRIEDGWVKWARWTPLLPRTVWRWWVGPDNELAGIQQWTFKNYAYGFVNIPADKLLLFSNRQEGNNYEGVSVFRSAYKPWFYKENYEKIDAIGIERNAVVPPIIHLPANATPADGATALSIVQNMRANQMMGVTLPFGWDLEYPKNEQKYAAAVLPTIQYHDIMIARNVLCQFLNLGSTETGAYSLDRSQVNTFLSSLQAVCEYIEDVINNDAIRKLVDYNFDNVEVYPKLQCSKLTAQNTADLAESLSKLMSGTAPLIQPDPQISNWLLDELGVPHSPQTQVEATNPTAPETPDRPENQRADSHANEQDKNMPAAPTDNAQGAGAEAAATSESMEQVRLLNETLERIGQMDAVDRGLTFSNPYPRQKGGLFGFGGPGHGAHAGGAGHHGGEGHPSEHDVSGEAHTGGGSGGTGHGGGGGGGGASRGSSSHSSSHEAKSEKAAPKARTSRAKGAATKAEKSGEEKPAARATKAAKGKASDEGKAKAQKSADEREAEARAKDATHAVKANKDTIANPIDVNRAYDPRAAVKVYGQERLGEKLSALSHGELKRSAELVGIDPGKTKQDTINRIVKRVTGKDISDTAHAAKVKSLETRIAKAQERLDGLKAQHAALTKAGESSARGKSRSSGSSKPSKGYTQWKAAHEKLVREGDWSQMVGHAQDHPTYARRYAKEEGLNRPQFDRHGNMKTSELAALEAAIDAETIHLNELLSELERDA